MRRRNLLTQVLVANLLIIVAAVVAAAFAASPDLTLNLDDDPTVGLVLGLAVGVTVLVNVYMLQRRFRPLERLVDQMEHVDLSKPGTNLPAIKAARRQDRRPRGSPAAARILPAHARAARGRAAARVERGAHRPGGGAGAHRPRPPRRGQPVAHRAAAAARGDEGADPDTLTHLAHELEGDEDDRQPGDGGAPGAGAPAAAHRARRPWPRRRPQRARRRLRPRRGRQRELRVGGRLHPPDRAGSARRLPRRPGGALEREAALGSREHPRPPQRGAADVELTVATTAPASPSSRRRAGSASEACASVRCSSAGT